MDNNNNWYNKIKKFNAYTQVIIWRLSKNCLELWVEIAKRKKNEVNNPQKTGGEEIESDEII